MEVTIMQPVTVDIAVLRVSVAVRYEEEDIPSDFPYRKGDVWEVDIDVEVGQIKDWPGPAFSMDMKVVDQGSYYLIDASGEIVAQREQDYVPSNCGIGGGDYVEMKWDENGFIEGWGKPDFGDIIAEEE